MKAKSAQLSKGEAVFICAEIFQERDYLEHWD